VLNKGGAERQLTYLLNALINVKEIQNDLLLLSDDINYNDVKDLPIRIFQLTRRVKRDITLFPKIYKLLKKEKPDIIQIWDSMSSFYVTLIAKFLGIKIINCSLRYGFMPGLFSQVRLINILTLPFATKIVANTKYGLEVNKQSKNNCSVIYNGYDFSRLKKIFDPDYIKTKYNITTKFTVTMIANFTIYKDYNTYFRAAEKILNARDDVTFLSAGRIDYSLVKPEIMEFVNKSEKIKMLGEIDNVDELINITDVGILCSSANGEGISNTVMEFMAHSKPVIVSDSRGTRELVEENESAFIIPCDGVNELVSKIIFLLDNPEKGKAMGGYGFEILNSKFKIERMLDDFINLYSNIN
jgi:glycosyltransferase involved in cell wall biosynthesis